MAKGGGNSKKEAGNAKKAEVAAGKKAQEDAKKAAAEDQQWKKGSKDNSKACVYDPFYRLICLKPTNTSISVTPPPPNKPKPHAKRPRRMPS